jgi:hypothetical protein
MNKAKAASPERKPYPTGEIPDYGDLVRIPADQISSYKKADQSRLVDRVGYIRSFSFLESHPVVMFAGEGRRKPFELGQVESKDLEFVSRKPADSGQ